MATWDGQGNDCDVDFGNAFLVRGDNPTLSGGGGFSSGNSCLRREMKFTSKTAKGISDAGETGHYTITMTSDEECCIDGRCSVNEVNLDKRIVKTNSAYLEETQRSVHFPKACPPGTYIQSEWRLI